MADCALRRSDTRAAPAHLPPDENAPGAPPRRLSLAPFQAPALGSSLAQMATSFGGFFGACIAMYLLAGLSYWLALPLALPAAGFLVRIFIIQHDCGHGSFFRSRRANHAPGVACSLLTLAPYASWRRHHAGHHAVWNNLDRRESGVDIYSSCLTVAEYRALGPGRRLLYRATRHPLVANLLLPPLVFLLLYRVPFDMPRSWGRERRALYATNAALVALFGGLGLAVGFDALLAVQLPVILLASIIGVWLFSVQHRFEETLWARRDRWRYAEAAIRGSSYLRLPALLRWFTGNIGFHHVHHLNPRIPNYRLQACHEANAALEAAPVLTLRTALAAWRYALWDEDRGRMVRFAREPRRLRAGTAP